MKLSIVIVVLLFSGSLFWKESYGAPPYANTGIILQTFFTDCPSSSVFGDDNYVYYLCYNLLYSIRKNSENGSISGVSINDYNGTALRFPGTSKLTSLSSTGKVLFLYDSAFETIMECPTNPLTACTSGIQSNATNVGGIFADQYNYVWTNGMIFANTRCCPYDYVSSVIVFDSQNNAIASFNLTVFPTNNAVTTLTGGIVILPMDDKLYIANGINVTSYAIKRNALYQPIALQFIATYTQLTSLSNYYIGLTYNKLGQVVALSNNGYVLVIDQYGGPSYFQLPDTITSTTGIWADVNSGLVYVTSGPWMYSMNFSPKF